MRLFTGPLSFVVASAVFRVTAIAAPSPPELELVNFDSVRTFETFFYVYLPEGYRDTSLEYPLMIFFVGSGEQGIDACPGAPPDVDPNSSTECPEPDGIVPNPTELLANGPFKPIKANGDAAPSGFGMEQFIFVVHDQWDPANNTDIVIAKEVYDVVTLQYRVDLDRVSVTGLSMGGNGVHSFVTTYPHLVSAAITVSAANTRSPIVANACSTYAERVPLWIFHGGSDNIGYGISVANTNTFFDTLNACPIQHFPARYSLVAGYGHSGTFWNDIYANLGAQADRWDLVSPGLTAITDGGYASVYDWAAQQVREQPPLAYPNITRSKSATASSQLNGAAAASKAVDGVIRDDARWQSVNNAGPHSLMVDLGVSHDVHRFRIATGNNLDGAAANLDIEYSIGDGAWSPVPECSFRNNTSQTLHCAPASAVIADKLRLTIFDSGQARVRELEAFGVRSSGGDDDGAPVGDDGAPTGGDDGGESGNGDLETVADGDTPPGDDAIADGSSATNVTNCASIGANGAGGLAALLWALRRRRAH